MGAKHDETVNCTSNATKYIMSQNSEKKVFLQNQEFSICSINAIRKKLDELRELQEKYKSFNKKEQERYKKFYGKQYHQCFTDKKITNPKITLPHREEKVLEGKLSSKNSKLSKRVIFKPFGSALTYGVIVPWICIITVCLILMIYDWKKLDKKHLNHIIYVIWGKHDPGTVFYSGIPVNQQPEPIVLKSNV